MLEYVARSNEVLMAQLLVELAGDCFVLEQIDHRSL